MTYHILLFIFILSTWNSGLKLLPQSHQFCFNDNWEKIKKLSKVNLYKEMRKMYRWDENVSYLYDWKFKFCGSWLKIEI